MFDKHAFGKRDRPVTAHVAPLVLRRSPGTPCHSAPDPTHCWLSHWPVHPCPPSGDKSDPQVDSLHPCPRGNQSLALSGDSLLVLGGHKSPAPRWGQRVPCPRRGQVPSPSVGTACALSSGTSPRPLGGDSVCPCPRRSMLCPHTPRGRTWAPGLGGTGCRTGFLWVRG